MLTARHDPPEELVKERNGEGSVTVSRAVDHALLDECGTPRGDAFDSNVKLSGDVTTAVRARAQLSHSPQVLPLLRCKTIKPYPEEIVVKVRLDEST